MAADLAPFLGKGWHFPPAFTSKGRDVHMVADEEDIQQSLRILLSTEQGERVMAEDFGCDLSRLLFEEISQGLVNTLTDLVSDAILRFEPRIDVSRIAVDESRDTAGMLLIGIDYTVRSTNSRFNMVFPFYVNEAIQPADRSLHDE